VINKKKILALVPARGGSKGIKLKNLKKINGKSLIQITSEFIDKCKFFDLKVVSSDNKKIIEHSKDLEFEIVKRSNKLSGDRVSDFQVIQESLIFIKDNLKYDFDYLIYLQPTSPVRKKKHLLDTIKKVIKFKYEGSWSVTKVDTKYHPLKSLKIVKNKLKLFDNRGQSIIARQMLNSVYIRNGVFYIFDIKSLIKNKSIYLKKILPSITEYKTANIDNLTDLSLAKKLVK
jgi:CMP-N,N'-diacetyllegionaminic acid synthase